MLGFKQRAEILVDYGGDDSATEFCFLCIKR